MIIDFNAMPEKLVPNFVGGEKEIGLKMTSDERNRILVGRLVPGASIGEHVHETSSEIIYLINGSGKVLYNGEYEAIKTGMCHYCPKGQSHSLINDSAEDLIFFAVVPQQ